MTALVEVEKLTVAFGGTTVVRDVALRVDPGECVAIVGESGSGKSVTARTLLGLTGDGADVRAETFRVDGEDATFHTERQWRAIRGARIGFVLQDALQSLDPLRPVGREVAETLRLHGLLPRKEARARAVELLRAVGVPEPELRATQYPHELSGGLRQRALIASAIAADPPLLIADEPTTALDVTVQAQILDLLEARRRTGTALLLISHDLAVVSRLADRVLVMKDGEVVEEGATADVLDRPGHPYTRTLLAAVPDGTTRGTRLSAAGRAAPRPPREPGDVVLEARDLTKRFGDRTAVDAVSFTLRAGETLGLVGESGSGKTTLARLVLGLLDPDGGEAAVDGRPWGELTAKERRALRRHVQVVYQDPLGSFDPRWNVRRVLHEALEVGDVPKRDRDARAAALLDQVGLPAATLDRRPRTLSGGQRQRVAIARALAPGPRVLVCDEPVSALDVSVQAQVLDLLADLRDELGMAYLFVSHHLGVVQHVSDRVAVMKDGVIVETGPVADVFAAPRAAYTRALLAAIPRIEPSRTSLEATT
ncbi:dipeptide ABC transporter ATP-binding protein [Actinomadura flavalba]|uniref:dipeptide ABC transporter ATP-binding protein n=1 Tax=Actinomadura flavalba TaxID=1120938 RepID=UPI00036C633F